MSEMSLEEAQQKIQMNLPPAQPECIPLLHLHGRVNAVEIKAPGNLPVYAQSAVDGYALGLGRERAGETYQVVGRILLGDDPTVPLLSGQACQVQTGSKLPEGTMAVVPHEKVEIAAGHLIPLEVVKRGNNIKRSGEDYQQGDILISPGQPITPGMMCLLAAFGIERVSVYPRPRVAVLGLSRNIVPAGTAPIPGQARDSNMPLIKGLLQENGGKVAASVMIGKREGQIVQEASALMSQADILVLIGGTYAQQGYEARQLMESLGARVLYWDVPIQPGSHTGAAVVDGKLIFALSGNPAACAVGYYLFVKPAVKAMQGLNPALNYLRARCVNGFAKRAGSRRFIRGRVCWDGCQWAVEVLPGQKPSMIRSLVDCNALIDFPAGSAPIEIGQEVATILIKPVC